MSSDVDYHFTGKTAVITGASGGIGLAAARSFAKAGASLILHYCRNDAPLREFSSATILQADFSESNAAERFVEQINEKTKSVDILVNAAGLDLMSAAMETLSFDEKMQQIFQTDVFATIRLSKFIGNRMKKRAENSSPESVSQNIFFFSWNGIDYGWNTETAQLYGAAKGAIGGFARSLAENLSPAVQVRTLKLGWITTRWGANASSEFTQKGNADSLMNRWGTAQEVADTVLFLSSDSASFVDGTNFFLDGTKRGA